LNKQELDSSNVTYFDFNKLKWYIIILMYII
jgi:hypothetical protein